MLRYLLLRAAEAILLTLAAWVGVRAKTQAETLMLT